jgi:hypothetical protein
VEKALLEVYVNVDARSREGYLNDTPVLEVFALTEPFGSELDTERLERSTGVARPVALGSDRRVLLDVTRIVRACLGGTRTNYGIVVGSLTGMREGDFEMATGRLPGGVVAQLHVYTTEATR